MKIFNLLDLNESWNNLCAFVCFDYVFDLAFLNLSDAVGRQAPPHQIQRFQGLGPATWNHPQLSNAAQEPQNSQLAEGLCFSIHGVSTLGCF